MSFTSDRKLTVGLLAASFILAENQLYWRKIWGQMRLGKSF